MKMPRTVALLALALFIGCRPINELDLRTDRIRQATSPHAVGIVSAEGNIALSYPGLGGSGVLQDAEGTYSFSPGAAAVFTINADGQMFITTHGDAVIRGLRYTPGSKGAKSSIEVESVRFNLSNSLAELGPSYNIAAQALLGMTQVEATVRIEQLRLAGDIVPEVAALLLKFLIPTLAR